ncbi:hypothetical protein HQ571_04050 [Candidatus Kuenenbacteria bacterium]|nr:hypothetical protein [Candidatus Kuenenbacteria bacterium]
MTAQWDKIFELIKKTGDRCIVIDGKTNQTFVIMDLDSYEKLMFRKSQVKDLTEDQMLDRINQDLSMWQATQFDDHDIDLSDVDLAEQLAEDEYYIEPVD